MSVPGSSRPEIQPLNARAESIAEKPMFKDAYRKRRCIVPIDAFYEKKKGRLYKFFMKDRQPFGVAGIWENWRNPAGDWERTFCVVTVEANDLVGCRAGVPRVDGRQNGGCERCNSAGANSKLNLRAR